MNGHPLLTNSALERTCTLLWMMIFVLLFCSYLKQRVMENWAKEQFFFYSHSLKSLPCTFVGGCWTLTWWISQFHYFKQWPDDLVICITVIVTGTEHKLICYENRQHYSVSVWRLKIIQQLSRLFSRPVHQGNIWLWCQLLILRCNFMEGWLCS